jgi:hypothetical protein
MQGKMSVQKERKNTHHLSRECGSLDGWVESLTSLAEDVQATQLLNEVWNLRTPSTLCYHSCFTGPCDKSCEREKIEKSVPILKIIA